MSYLSIDGSTLPDFTKATISLWFRAPLATLEKARDAAASLAIPFIPAVVSVVPNPFTAGTTDLPTMAGIVPLVTFGRPQTRNIYTSSNISAGSYTLQHWSYPGGDALDIGPWTRSGAPVVEGLSAQAISLNSTIDLPPCYIGIECVPASTDGSFPTTDLYTLKVHLQMDGADGASPSVPPASKVGLFYYNSASASTDIDDYSTGGFGVGGVHGPEFSVSGGYGTYVWTNDFHETIDGVPQPVEPAVQFDGQFWPALYNYTQTFTYTDISGPTWTAPEIFELGGRDTDTDTSPNLVITPDTWHHVLISIDLTGEVKTSGYTFTEANDPTFIRTVAKATASAARAWIAFDDTNITGKNLSALYPDPDYSDVNGIITIYALTAAQTRKEPNTDSGVSGDGGFFSNQEYPGFERAEFSYTSASIPVSDAPMGIPASADHVDNVYNVEMAEFQMFTGVALDTSDPTARRAFIDSDGKPVDPNQKGAQDSDGNTTRTSGSIEYLGQEPDVLLHGSGNWIKGKNTGGSHDDGTGNQIPGDQFDPTGKIIRYKPNPSLHGAQSPPQLKR